MAGKAIIAKHTAQTDGGEDDERFMDCQWFATLCVFDHRLGFDQLWPVLQRQLQQVSWLLLSIQHESLL